MESDTFVWNPLHKIPVMFVTFLLASILLQFWNGLTLYLGKSNLFLQEHGMKRSY
jgi:hypothetical protein